MATVRRQSSAARRASTKYRRKYARLTKHRSNGRLTTKPRSSKQRAAVAKLKSSGFYKRVAALRSSHDIPFTLSEGTAKISQAFLDLVLEAATEFSDAAEAREFAAHYATLQPWYTGSQVGLCALALEAFMCAEAAEVAKLYVESIVDPGDETFLVVFQGQLSDEMWEKFRDDVDFADFDILVEAGDVDEESGAVSDLTIVEVTPRGDQAEVDQLHVDDLPGEHVAPVIEVTESDYRAALKEGVKIDTLKAIFRQEVADQVQASGASLVWEDPNGVLWTLSGERWLPLEETIKPAHPTVVAFKKGQKVKWTAPSGKAETGVVVSDVAEKHKVKVLPDGADREEVLVARAGLKLAGSIDEGLYGFAFEKSGAIQQAKDLSKENRTTYYVVFDKDSKAKDPKRKFGFVKKGERMAGKGKVIATYTNGELVESEAIDEAKTKVTVTAPAKHVYKVGDPYVDHKSKIPASTITSAEVVQDTFTGTSQHGYGMSGKSLKTWNLTLKPVDDSVDEGENAQTLKNRIAHVTDLLKSAPAEDKAKLRETLKLLKDRLKATNESLDEGISDELLKKFAVPGKSLLLPDNNWWTIKSRDIEAGKITLSLSDYAIKDGAKKQADKSMSWGEFAGKAGKSWGIRINGKQYGPAQDQEQRAKLRAANGKRKAPGAPDVKESIEEAEDALDVATNDIVSIAEAQAYLKIDKASAKDAEVDDALEAAGLKADSRDVFVTKVGDRKKMETLAGSLRKLGAKVSVVLYAGESVDGALDEAKKYKPVKRKRRMMMIPVWTRKGIEMRKRMQYESLVVEGKDFPVGTVRTWGGRTFKKGPNGDWIEQEGGAATKSNPKKEQAKKDRAAGEKMSDKEVAGVIAKAAKSLEGEDAEALLSIADDVKNGNREAAFRYANKLDTAVRETIPAAAWVALGGKLVHETEEEVEETVAGYLVILAEAYSGMLGETEDEFVLQFESAEMAEAVRELLDIEGLVVEDYEPTAMVGRHMSRTAALAKTKKLAKNSLRLKKKHPSLATTKRIKLQVEAVVDGLYDAALDESTPDRAVSAVTLLNSLESLFGSSDELSEAEPAELSEATFKTENETWGFFGTMRDSYGLSNTEAADAFDQIGKQLKAYGKTWEDKHIRRLLDSKVGRHLADELSFSGAVQDDFKSVGAAIKAIINRPNTMKWLATHYRGVVKAKEESDDYTNPQLDTVQEAHRLVSMLYRRHGEQAGDALAALPLPECLMIEAVRVMEGALPKA